jgi:outer membrane protein, adhesin transport system
VRLTAVAIFAFFAVGQAAHAQGVYSIIDAINQGVRTNPSISEAAANRRATESELRQNQGTLLPQVRLEARIGPEKFDHHITPPPTGNDQWRTGREASIVVRQLLFDGFSSINEIWRQAARVDAAAARVHERSELIALDSAEAYIDVVRYLRLVAIAQENLAAHRRIFSNVNARYSGGRAGEGDLQQAQERVDAAAAALAGFRQSLEDSRAKYRRAVGLEPYNLRFPGRLRGMPGSRDEALAVALRHNPTIKAAQHDADAAKYGFHSTAGLFTPTVSLEGRASHGVNVGQFLGERDELSGKVVASWDIFRGGQNLWRRNEMAERYVEQTQRHARLQRDAFESLDKAWAARTITNDRIAALVRQSEADRRVIAAYTKEYELGQRSLIDLLNAQNQLFNASVSLVSAQGVAVFADFQLLAAMGHLLEYLKAAPPAEASPLEPKPFGLFPTRLPPILIELPKSGPEPLAVGEPDQPARAYAATQPGVIKFGERWPSWMSAPNLSFMTGMSPRNQQSSGAAAPAAAVAAGSPQQAPVSLAPDTRPWWASGLSTSN